MSKKMILISGSTGFVGSNLIPYLEAKNYKTLGVSRKNTSGELLSYDDLSIDHFNTSHCFIHLAGKAHDLKKTTLDEEYYKINTDLTVQLYDNFLQSSCKIFIFMSTVKAAADTTEKELIEEIIPNPVTVYGKSKLKAEEYIRSKKLPKEKRVFILRPCMIYGKNNKGNLNLLYKIISNSIPYPLGSYHNKRSFLSVENLCFVIEKLMEKLPESGTYNVADNEKISTTELVKIIGKTIDKKVRVLNVPKFMIKSIALFGDILPIPLNTERLDKLTENYCVSNDKIKKAIGENLLETTQEGIAKTILSFKNITK